MNIRGLKIQRLKRDIGEIREKLNMLMDQNTPDIIEEVLDTSQKLDILIVNYYCILQEGKCSRFSESK